MKKEIMVGVTSSLLTAAILAVVGQLKIAALVRAAGGVTLEDFNALKADVLKKGDELFIKTPDGYFLYSRPGYNDDVHISREPSNEKPEGHSTNRWKISAAGN